MDADPDAKFSSNSEKLQSKVQNKSKMPISETSCGRLRSCSSTSSECDFINGSPYSSSPMTGSLSMPIPEEGKEPKAFRVHLDLGISQLRPEDLKVKVVENHLIAEGNQVEQRDYGPVSHYFTRKYSLPWGSKSNVISVSLGENGVLTVLAVEKQ